MKDTIRTVAATAPMSASVSTINRVNLSGASAAMVSTAPHQIMHGTVVVDGLNIAYREAGNSANPKLVLHGFPASSHQYRNLVTALADRFHVIAPDYPGFGNSDAPDPAKFPYTFDKLSEVVEAFLQARGFDHYGLYVRRSPGKPRARKSRPPKPHGTRVFQSASRWPIRRILNGATAPSLSTAGRPPLISCGANGRANSTTDEKGALGFHW